MIKLFKYTLLSVFLAIGSITVQAQLPQLGTEIWVEPGYSKEKVMEFAKITSESGLKDVRIFMMWTHVEPSPNQWDFEVYDYIFEACEKYNLKLQVTLNANQPAWHYGKDYWSSIHQHDIFTESRMEEPAARYIKKVVERYHDNPALDYWWIMNEPKPGYNEDSFKIEGFRIEMRNKYKTIETLNKRWNTSFDSFEEINDIDHIMNAEWAASMPWYDWNYYCNQHLTNFQKWTVDEIKKHDPIHPITTNPAAYLVLYSRQEASKWMPFLDAFGISIHPTWHFGMFKVEQYALGFAASCELAKSVSSPKPYWVSELSGGDNLYRYCPTSQEIAQWTWTSIAQGASKIIYWLLNHRTSGLESGEWALLNFQNEPSDRLKAATEITKCIDKHASFFGNAKSLKSNISILLSPETNMTYSRKKYRGIYTESAVACYEALAERGIASNIIQTQDFKWSKVENHAVIMSSMLTLPTYLIDSVKSFLDRGNKLIVLGPNGFYNEFEDCLYLDFPLSNEFGAKPEELRTLENHFQITSDDGRYQFDCSGIFGILKPTKATPILKREGYIAGTRYVTDNSEVVWIPSEVNYGAWKFDNSTLSQFLSDELKSYSKSQPFIFSDKTDKVLLQTMVDNEGNYLTVITNGLNEPNSVKLGKEINKNVSIVFSTDKNKKGINSKEEFELAPRECLVLLWGSK